MFDYICVLDFEATCDRNKTFVPDHEVIEFPSVLLRKIDNRYEVVSEFQQFCRPLYNVKLTEFCKELTGITQAQVSPAENFPDVLEHHRAWLEEHAGGLEPERLIIVTCGRWDLLQMLPAECRRWVIKPHTIYHRAVNIKDAFCQRYGPFRGGMAAMLAYMELELLGRHHSGIDDCRNIARMAVQLANEITPELVLQVDPSLYNLTSAERAKAKATLQRQLVKRQ